MTTATILTPVIKKNYESAYASIEITINYPVFQKTYSSTYLTLKLRNCTQLSTT